MHKQRKKELSANVVLCYTRTVPLTFVQRKLPHPEETTERHVEVNDVNVKNYQITYSSRNMPTYNCWYFCPEGESLLNACKPSRNLHIIKRKTATFNVAAMTQQNCPKPVLFLLYDLAWMINLTSKTTLWIQFWF